MTKHRNALIAQALILAALMLAAVLSAPARAVPTEVPGAGAAAVPASGGDQ